jgi:ribosome-binding factor A
MEQFDALIKREVSTILQRIYTDYFITVTQVHVTKDLSYAKIWLSSPIDTDKAVEIAQSARKEIRQELSRKVIARKVPALNFVPDKTPENAARIEELVREIKKD